MSPPLITYSKSTPTLVGCQFPGMSPPLITYSKSTPTLVGCQFPGMSPDLTTAISRHQPLWAVSSLRCHQTWLLTPSRHQPFVGCQFPGMSPDLTTAISRNQPLWAVSSLRCHQTWLLTTLVGCQVVGWHSLDYKSPTLVGGLSVPSRHLGCQFPPALITYSKSTPTLVGCQFPGMSPALITYSKSTPSLVGCQFPGISPALITYSKSTSTLVGCQFPGTVTTPWFPGCHQPGDYTPSRHQPLWAVSSLGMSPALITYSKSTSTLVVCCQFPGMSPDLITAISRHQPLWAVSKSPWLHVWHLVVAVRLDNTWLPSRHQPLWAVSSLVCHQT